MFTSGSCYTAYLRIRFTLRDLCRLLNSNCVCCTLSCAKLLKLFACLFSEHVLICFPTVILIVILIIIGIPSPTHSFTLGLNPSFSANPPYPSLFFLIQVSLYGFPRLFTLLLSISVFLLFSFSVFTLFSCRFHAVD